MVSFLAIEENVYDEEGLFKIKLKNHHVIGEIMFC